MVTGTSEDAPSHMEDLSSILTDPNTILPNRTCTASTCKQNSATVQYTSSQPCAWLQSKSPSFPSIQQSRGSPFPSPIFWVPLRTSHGMMRELASVPCLEQTPRAWKTCCSCLGLTASAPSSGSGSSSEPSSPVPRFENSSSTLSPDVKSSLTPYPSGRPAECLIHPTTPV